MTMLLPILKKEVFNVRFIAQTRAFATTQVVTKKAKKQPEGPKRPPAAYALFIKENFSHEKAENPNLKSTEILSQLGSAWKSLGNGEKSKYEEEAKNQLAAYKKKKEDYLASLPEKEVYGYAKFMKEKFATYFVKSSDPNDRNKNFGEVSKKVAAEWKSLPESEKKLYKKPEN
ncbi:hypothetical protein PACTADRAFT_51035 [Pachysolen tannophilus NRRL Y-2460]|uniref:HMG box domain-containing protein n=1 Tax=Pachysolen tannophilus NRRL Y-2460 TaxID=669874 RepID=A0A1E4TR00_PACTA|nr:hypothetical protein PACTADRAFT_51035 [Pachysolen tannophilus NRRL Y-2460]